jgi:hypothetical protein
MLFTSPGLATLVQPLLQVDAVQVWPVAQALLHRPQCVALVRRSVSHPLAGLPSQSPKLPSQVNPQAPPVHVALALARAGQTLLHAPQCATVEASETSHPSVRDELQSPKPAVQTKPQVPVAQAARALATVGQTVPQPPQLEGSVAVLVQARPQAMSPAPQVTWQEPPEQT